MTLRRYGNTDEQEEALGKVEKWAKRLGFRLVYGTSIGKSPQTVILDHDYQDNFVYINDDGSIQVVNDYDVKSFSEFKKMIEAWGNL